MDVRLSRQDGVPFRDPAHTLGALDADTAAQVLAAAGDIAIVVDEGGVIRDMAVAIPDLADEGVTDWLDRPWAETVAPDSREKIQQMLRDAKDENAARWREVNHTVADGEMLPVRYLALEGGAKGGVIAIGRDLRGAALMQQRLLQAQQSMERDYARLRQAESRYRLLFQLASEAVLIVDAASHKVLEANPAAQRLLQVDESALVGQSFALLLQARSREPTLALFAALHSVARQESVRARLAAGGAEVFVTASLFRQERAAHLMVRLSTREAPAPETPQAQARLLDALERMPDAFVVTDEDLRVLAHNAAFLDLAQLAAAHQAIDQPLERFVGRPGVDLKVLMASLREHGSVRSFATILRSPYDTTEEVEISAISLLDARTPGFAFSLRAIGRRLRDQPASGRELPRSVSQLTSLVGRVSLKEIVRETTDRIERLCIEAALELTADNRASAAELLGLSRQSFYSKLHRHGLGNLSADGG